MSSLLVPCSFMLKKLSHLTRDDYSASSLPEKGVHHQTILKEVSCNAKDPDISPSSLNSAAIAFNNVFAPPRRV